MKRIVFSAHSRRQNRDRKIPLIKIKQTILSPDNTEHSYRNRELKIKLFAHKTLVVVVAEESETITVVTQYYIK